ncbi:MAG TPA: four helix bundle protein [Candidatus Cloacimonetes bacterium]|nr:four helix bundle protein [Candidatus Cloacimonadota bacterium]
MSEKIKDKGEKEIRVISHEDLNVWKDSINLVTEIYRLTKDFPQNELYGLTNQIRRSAISIPSNIAEGSGRKSKKEYIQFLYVSLGSIVELDTQLIIAKNLGYLPNKDIRTDLLTIKKMLIGLIHSLERKESK